MFHALRERERVLELIESVTGGRFHPNFNRVGGIKPNAGGGSDQKKVSMDLPAGFFEQTRAAMVRVLDACDDLDTLVTGNEVFKARTLGVGVIPAAKAIEYGLSGPTCARRAFPTTCARSRTCFPTIRSSSTSSPGRTVIAYDRYLVRLNEIREAAQIVVQAVDKIDARSAAVQGPPGLEGAEGPGLRQRGEPQGRVRVLRHLRRREDAPTASRSGPHRSATSRSCPGCSKAPSFPTSSPSWEASTSSSETWTDESRVESRESRLFPRRGRRRRPP